MGRSDPRRHPTPSASAITDRAIEERLRDQLGGEVTGIGPAMGGVPPVSIRVNAAKWMGRGPVSVPWCDTGFYLEERPAFTFDPLFHAGCYYVQEASSMLLEQAVKASGLMRERIVALDLCAAPGGKSTHLRSLLHPGSLLVANEIDRKRQHILLENCWKWGAPDMVVTGGSPSDLQQLPEFFDLVLVDAPCSGEGMFRKDPFARQQWSPALVNSCALTQRHILDVAWRSLRPGGCLIYSTCTWELEENECQLRHLVDLGASCITIPVDPAWGVVVSQRYGTYGLRCYPHRVSGEGFFLAAVRKEGNWSRPPDEREAGIPPPELRDSLERLRPDRRWATVEQGGVHFAVSADRVKTIDRIGRSLRMLSPGIPLAERKGRDLRPHPALALSTALMPDPGAMIALDLEAALSYLRGSTRPAVNAKGAALVTYDGVGLGWLHGAGNRWNNPWPASWRIRARQASAPPVSWSRA